MNKTRLATTAAAIAAGFAALSARAEWTYNGSTIADETGWVLTVSRTTVNGTNELTTTAGALVTLPGDSSVLDLRKPVGAYNGLPCVIVGMAGNAGTPWLHSKAYPATLLLPDTFRSLGQNLMMYNSALTTISPFLPSSLTSLGNGLQNCALLTGNLALGGGGVSVSFPQGGNFSGTGIRTADIREGVTSLGDYFFSSCKSLNDVELSPDVHAVVSRTFSSCTLLTNVIYRGSCPQTAYGNAFGNTYESIPALQVRTFVPRHDFTWEAYIETSAAKAYLTAAETNAYIAKFGPAAPLPYCKFKTDGISSRSYQYFLYQNDPLTCSNAVMVRTDSVKADDVTPAYGVNRGALAVGIPVVLTASALGALDGTTYHCVGYTFEKLGASGWETLADVDSGNTCPYTPATADSVRITWKWELAGYSLAVHNTGVSPADGTSPLGSVSATAPNAGDNYAPGTVVALTATETAGAVFRRWCGDDIPAGHATDNPLQITMNANKVVYPYFETGWVYASGKLKDGYWTLAASGAASAIAVGKPSVNWAGGYLDLSKSIVGGGAFTSLVANFLTGNGYVETLVLPEDTLVSVGSNAFGNENNVLKSITPFLPDSVRTIGEGICRKSRALTNDVFALRGGTSMGGALHFESNNGSLKGIILGEGIRMIPANSFNGISGLTNVVMGGAVTNIGATAFHACSAVVNFQPLFPVGIQYLGTDAMRKCGTQPNATLVLDNGKKNIAFAAQNLFFESNNSISNMFVGAGVTALPANFLVNGKRKLKEAVFKGYTTWSSTTFGTCEAYKSRFIVPKANADWTAWHSDPANVKPWSECGANTNTYWSTFGGKAKRPVGLTLKAPINVWIVPQDFGSGLRILVR